jgi:putative phage-type endonuclease
MQHPIVSSLPGAAFTQFPTREAWLAGRRAGIGSSDAAAILGLSRFKSALGLYYDKIGMGEEHPRAAEAAAWGLALEGPIAGRYAEITGRYLGSPPTYSVATSERYSFAIASLDKFAVGMERRVEHVVPREGVGVVEIKNVHYFMADMWSAENNNEPPLEYQIQVQHQLMVTGLQWGSIAALIGGSEFLWADIPRDEAVIAMLAEKELEFWCRVLEHEPPAADGSESSKEILKKLYPRDTGETIALGVEGLELHERLVAAKAAIKSAEDEKGNAENRLKQLLGNATWGTLPNGMSYSFKSQDRASFVSPATSFRVLRSHKAAK